MHFSARIFAPGYLSPKVISSQKKRTIVGGNANADIVVYDASISGEHFEIIQTKGGLEIHDLGSSSGTYINGMRIEKAAARPGDFIAFGNVLIKIRTIAPK